MDAQPKTLAELAAIANGGAQQWTCRRCGGTTWWVRNSYFVASDNTRHRKRECRTCHQVLYTREAPIESDH